MAHSIQSKFSRVQRGLAALFFCGFLVAVGALGTLSAGGTKLPTAEEVKQQQAKFKAEHDALLKNGAKLFQPQFLEKAQLFAKKAEDALKENRLLQAKQGFIQARWQLPYLGPTVPDNVSRVLGNLRMRHTGGINQLVYSPDGKFLATGSDDRSVKIWDLDNGHETRQFVGHGDAVRTLAWSPDGKLIASAGGDEYIKVWNPADGKVSQTLRTQGAYVTSVVFSNDSKYLLSGWSNNAIRIYEADTGNLVRTVAGLPQRVESLALTPDGKILGATVADGQIQLFDFPRIVQNPNQPNFWQHNDLQGACHHIAFSADGKKFARCNLHNIKIYDTADSLKPPDPNPPTKIIPPPAVPDAPLGAVKYKCSAFSKDGKMLFTGCSDGIIRLYDVSTNNPPLLLGTFKGHNAEVTSLAWNADGTELASSSGDFTVRLWPFDIVAQSREFVGHTGEVWSAGLSPDGKMIVSASADKTLKIWDAAAGKALFTLDGHTGPVTVALFSPDGGTVLSASGDKTLKLWNANTGKLINTIPGHQGTITAADFSSDGKKIVSGAVDKEIRIWEVGGKLLQTIPVSSLPTAVVFHPNGKQVASGHVDQSIHLWDADTGKSISTWIAHGGAVTGLSFTQTGQHLASCGTDALAKVWPMANPGNNPLVFVGHTEPLTSVAIRGDGKLLVTGGSDKVVKVWKVAEGGSKEPPQDFRGHRDWVTSVAFSKDGYYIASGSIDQAVRLWELTSKELPLLSEHTGAVKAVAVSPDGTLLASAATDQTIKIWDLKTGIEKLTLKGHAGYVIALAFAPDNKTLFSSGTDRNIYQWDVATGTKAAPNPNWTGLQIPAPALQVSTDGKKLLIWSPVGPFSTKVKMSDLPGGAGIEGVDQNRNVLAAAFAADGKTIALPAADGSVRIYLVNNNQMEAQPGGDWFTFKIGIKATSAALTADGKTIAAGNEKGEIKIADVVQRNVLQTLQGHTSKVRALVISPDAKLLASSGDDNVIKLWDMKSGKMLRQWDINVPEQIDRNFTPQLVFTPDSKALITANANTTLYVLELP